MIDMAITIKDIFLNKPSGITDRGSLELHHSNGTSDSIILYEGMDCQQAGTLLVQLGHRLIKRYVDDQVKDDQTGSLFEKLVKDKLISPIRVSRKHMEELEISALNCTNEEIRFRFEELKKDPGFEIVDFPIPGEFLQDLSVMFMYPNEIVLIKHNKNVKDY